MSDSSNHLNTQNLEFNSDEFFRKLCQKTKIVVPDGVEIRFPKGWSGIAQDFVSRVKGYSIMVTKISDFYSVLEIDFNVNKSTKESQVWRLISSARKTSTHICGNCGEHKGYRRQASSTSVLCETCSLNAHLINKTGTWLDNC